MKVFDLRDAAERALSCETFCQGVVIKVRPKFNWAAKTPPVDVTKIKLSSKGTWEEQACELATALRLPNSIAPAEKKVLDAKIDRLCDDVQNTLLGFFTNAQCFVFGSRVTGLAGVDSDIDLYAQLGKAIVAYTCIF